MDSAQPPTRIDGSELLPEAVCWFETWASSAHAAAFLPWDWQRLEMATLLVDVFYAEPSAGLMREIRAIEDVLEEVPEREATRRLYGGHE